MSARVTEVVGQSATLLADNATISRQYKVAGVASDADATLAVRNYLILTLGNPPNLGSLTLDSINTAEEIRGVYNATANWRTFQRRSQPATGETQFNFEMSLDPVKVRVPVGGVAIFRAAEAEEWEPELINDQGDGEAPEGIDVYEPTYEESVTVWGPTAGLTPAYRNALKRCVGKTNSQPFKGWGPGEVLMRGISGTRRGYNDSELTFRWSVRENQFDLTVGEVTGITKGGWQYLWPRYTAITNSSGLVVQTITHVCVATVFRSVDYLQLKIGA